MKELILNNDWCKLCRICVEFCPKKILELKDDCIEVTNYEECTLCGLCEMRCPDYAIYIRNNN